MIKGLALKYENHVTQKRSDHARCNKRDLIFVFYVDHPLKILDYGYTVCPEYQAGMTQAFSKVQFARALNSTKLISMAAIIAAKIEIKQEPEGYEAED